MNKIFTLCNDRQNGRSGQTPLLRIMSPATKIERHQMAKKLKAKGMNMEDIVDLTGLSEDEIAKI